MLIKQIQRMKNIKLSYTILNKDKTIMKHKDYVKQVNKEKELYHHNRFHKDKKDNLCLYCEIFPNNIKGEPNQ